MCNIGAEAIDEQAPLPTEVAFTGTDRPTTYVACLCCTTHRVHVARHKFIFERVFAEVATTGTYRLERSPWKRNNVMLRYTEQRVYNLYCFAYEPQQDRLTSEMKVEILL